MRNQDTAKQKYLRQMFSTEDSLLKEIQEQSITAGVDRMQISAYEGRILQFLCQALKVKKAIEIGTLHGYSSLMIARALPKDGQLFTLDIDKTRQEKAQHLTEKDPAGKKIQFINGPALDSLKTLEKEGPFDMVFIDADKPAYLDYLHWSNQNLKPGGLLAADNTFLFGAIYGEPEREQTSQEALQVMQKFNEEIAQSGKYISTLIPTTEGLTVGIKK